MSMLFFTFRAQLKAQKGVSVLKDQGIPAKMGRTPGMLAVNGCGYGLWIPVERGKEARDVLHENGLMYEKCYRMDNGRPREVKL